MNIQTTEKTAILSQQSWFTRATRGLTSLALGVFASSTLSAQTIFTEFTDLSLRMDRTDNVTVTFPAGANSGTGESALNVGKSGVGAGFDRAAIVMFLLPDLGMVADPFGSASFSAYINQRSISNAVGGDLYGLPRRATSDPLLTDYFGRDAGPDPTAGVVLIQDNFLTNTTTVNAQVTTSTAGNDALRDYLNAQYDGGNGIGEYVFLRINTDADTTQRWNMFSADGASSDAETPQINYLVATDAVDTIRVESLPDGTGAPIPAQTLTDGAALTVYSVARDAGGNFLENIPVTWSLANSTGGIDAGDLIVAADGKSATFTAAAPGAAEIALLGNATNLVPSGLITVDLGAASQVLVETEPDGSGVAIAEQTVFAGDNLLAYAISRDAAGNFVENVAATWSLENVTGDILATDLEPSVDTLSATFFSDGTGTAVIRATASGLPTADSGVLTVADLVPRFDRGGANASWSTAENWFGDILPFFDNQTDLLFYEEGVTRLNTYLGATRTARSLNYEAAADGNLSIRFTITSVTNAADMILDTDSLTEPAEINIDADAEGNFVLGNTTDPITNSYGSLILADDVLITHNGFGNLTIDAVISENGGSRNLTKTGEGTLILAGNNTYTGTTTVDQGKIVLNGDSLDDAGTLSITGTGLVEITAGAVENVSALIINGVAQPDGVYGSSTSDAPTPDDVSFQGGGTINVGAPMTNAFEDFVSVVTNPDDRDLNDDPDGDGIPNGIEFVIGGTPLDASDLALLPAGTLVNEDLGMGATDYLLFSFRAVEGSDIVQPAAEYDTDLQGEFWTLAINGSDGVVVQTVVDGFGAGVNRIDAYLPASLAEDGKLFARLSVLAPF